MPRLSIVIPTYQRANTLLHVLSALKNQSCKDFQVVVVIKPSGDGTEEIVKRYADFLDITTIIKKGYVVDVYLPGAKHSEGGIAGFLDDDAFQQKTGLKRT
jgi:hypothetical protein